MAKFKFELNRSGVADLLKGNEMRSLIGDVTNQIQQSAGELYEGETKIGSTRVYGTVHASNAHGYYHNLKHNTLVNALKGSSKK